MSLVSKIKKHGIKGSLELIPQKIANGINNLAYYICWIFPVDEKLIVMESEGDLCDNAFALYDYMKDNGYLDKYKVVWLVDDVKEAKKNNWKNTDFVVKNPTNVQLKRSKYLATCKYFIYDHCNMLHNLYKRKECFVFNLWHGCGYKDGKAQNPNDKTRPNITLVTGKFFIPQFEQIFKYKREEITDLGYPRSQYFFYPKNENQLKFYSDFNLSKYKKVLFWMPTFRRSDNEAIDETYFDSNTGLPIVTNKDLLEAFNEDLRSKNTLCIFKLHHLQSELNIFKQMYSNILILKDEEIKEYGLQLYQVLPFADALITDYSSISTDYLLLDRPIIFTTDDYEEYRKSRGFVPDNSIDYFAGDCVNNYDQFIKAVNDVIADTDKYIEKRKKMTKIMQTYVDGSASQRILDLLKL